MPSRHPPSHIPAGFRGTEHPLPEGSPLGQLMTVERVLGMGSTSVVYAVRHAYFADPVAVKVLRLAGRSTQESCDFLVHEAQVNASLPQARIPRVYYVDQLDDGSPFIVMEKIPGVTMRTLLSRGPLKPTTACALIVELLEALGQIHAQGVIHRDIKPGNLLLSRSERGAVKLYLLDLGAGKLAPRKGTAPFSFDSALVGTPSYMAPELLSGGKADARTDLYASGVVLYQALTGRVPFRGETTLDIVTAVLRDPAPPVLELAPDVPPALAEAVERAIDKDPRQRFASAGAMKRALVTAAWSS